MFPIQESGGKVIGFGGRTLTDSVPKYLNSPETDLFKKRYVLYGLHQFRSLKCDHVFVVEGYMDVISLHSQGITNAVACLGTAFTVHHWHLIKKFVRRVTFCFDGDRAGKDAAWKSLCRFCPPLTLFLKFHFFFYLINKTLILLFSSQAGGFLISGGSSTKLGCLFSCNIAKKNTRLQPSMAEQRFFNNLRFTLI